MTPEQAAPPSRRRQIVAWALGSIEAREAEEPLLGLLEKDAVAWEERMRILPPGGMMNVPYFAVEGARVWGATAMVLAEFIAVIEELAG